MASPESRSIFDKNNPHGIYPQLANLEDRLKLPSGFCEALAEEDDWSFVIKLHALLEAALTSLLVTKIGDANLHDPFSRLEMSKPGTGKVEFAKALGLLERPDRRFITGLSELRNTLIHRIENVTFDLKAHVASFDQKQKSAFTQRFGWWDGGERGAGFETLMNYATTQPKRMIWQVGLIVVTTMMMQAETSRYERDIDASYRALGKERSLLGGLLESRDALRRLFDEAASAGPASEAE